MRTIILIVAGIIAAIIVIFYYALHTKAKTVSSYMPFKAFLGKPLVTQRDALLVKNLQQYSFENSYLLTETTASPDTEITEKYLLPKGTILLFEKAALYKNGVSGFTQIESATPQRTRYAHINFPIVTMPEFY